MKKIRKRIAGYLVLILMIAGGLPARAYGAGTTVFTETTGSEAGTVEAAGTSGGAQGDGNTAQEADVMNYLPVTEPENAPDPDTVKPVYEQVSYTQDEFFPEKTLKGIYSASDLYFYVQDYWDTRYVYAQIQYNVSQLIESTASSVTFAVNQVPVRSFKLEYKNGSTQTLYVKIPISQIRAGYNSFTVSAYARLFDEEGCVDDYSDANWLNIDDASYIRCGYEIRDPEHKISWYPYPFMSTCYPTGAGLTIAVSDQAADGEVAAAMSLMAGLSADTKTKNEIQVCLLSGLADTDPTRTIVVSGYDNLPQEYRQLVLNAPDSAGNATVSFTDDARGYPLLIITSADEESLMEAAYMLMDESRRLQEGTSSASVEKGSSQIAVNAAKQNDMMAGNYTLEEILGGGLTYVGPFHQENYVYLPVSKDFAVAEGGKAALKFRYSENLDFTRSLISVYWGDVPVASKKLSKDNASGDELNFEIPTDVMGTAASSMKIAFDLEIADLICTPRQNDMPWAYVSRESAIFLPPSSEVTLSFDLKASPFSKAGKFNDVMLVMTDAPDSDELNLLGQIAAMYGNGARPYGNLTVKRAGEFSREDADYNIITTGTYGSNALISQINGELNFKYTSDGTAFESNEQLILSKEYGKKIAVMQLLKSPYALNRGLLAVTGSDEGSLRSVQEYLRDSEERDKLTKDCVIIDPEFKVTAFRFIQDGTAEEEPAPMKKLVQNKRSLIFTATATAAMFMMLLAVIIILLRIGTYRKKNET